MERRLFARWLGRRRYEPVHRLQHRLLQQRRAGQIDDTVLFVEHEPVITLGRGARAEHVLAAETTLARRGVDRVTTGRGGDVTLHAPGQLVCYPLIDLAPDRRDVRRYVGDLRRTMGQLAARFGIQGGSVDGLVGLWVDRASPDRWPGALQAQDLAKLGAIGIRLSRWKTMHGFAFNLTPDLDLFRLIVPCGVRDHAVTSVEALTGTTARVDQWVEPTLQLLAGMLDAQIADLTDHSREEHLETASSPVCHDG